MKKTYALKHAVLLPISQSTAFAAFAALFVYTLASAVDFTRDEIVAVVLLVMCAVNVVVFPFAAERAAERFARALAERPTAQGLLTYEQALQLRERNEVEELDARKQTQIAADRFVLFQRYKIPWTEEQVVTLFNVVVERGAAPTERNCTRKRAYFSQADLRTIRDAAVQRKLAFLKGSIEQHGWEFSHAGREAIILCAFKTGVDRARFYMSKRSLAQLHVARQRSPTRHSTLSLLPEVDSMHKHARTPHEERGRAAKENQR